MNKYLKPKKVEAHSLVLFLPAHFVTTKPRNTKYLKGIFKFDFMVAWKYQESALKNQKLQFSGNYYISIWNQVFFH